MPAYELTIRDRVERDPFTIVSAGDFEASGGRSVDPQAVLERPTLSLYCLGHANRRALLVDTPPEIDLFQAPFYFIAQYEAAQRLVAVPYSMLHALAHEVQLDPHASSWCIQPDGAARRWSATFSAAVSFSEPDVFTQLGPDRYAVTEKLL